MKPPEIQEALTVRCPKCWAPPEESCVAMNGMHKGYIMEPHRTHQARLEKARREKAA